MKALTIKQPWAWAIAHKGKDFENRTWQTHYRGELAIHAGLALVRGAEPPRGVRWPDEEALVKGAIIAVADLVDVVEYSRSKWFQDGFYGWFLKNIRPLGKPIACTGHLGLWSPSPSITRRVRKQA